MNLAVHSKSNDILSFRSYFQSKGGTFFETPGILIKPTYSLLFFIVLWCFYLKIHKKVTFHIAKDINFTHGMIVISLSGKAYHSLKTFYQHHLL